MRIIALLFFTAFLSLSGYAQASSEEALILQKCIGLEDLRSLYPRQSDGTFAPLQVLQHGVSFRRDISVAYLGKPVQFVEKSQIADKSDARFFLFQDMQINGDAARASFAYHYSRDEAIVVELWFEKGNADWNIVKSKIEKR